VPYIPDTHALVWYLTADKQLGKQAKAALASVDAGSERAIIPVLVLAEIMYLEEKGRIRIKLNELVEYLQSNENYSMAPLTLSIVLAAKSLHRIPELFDRMIAATALEHDAVLLTRDSVFHNLSTVKIAW
jgi:PIN domain nuclease of toxin-antitoxin system